MKKFFKALPIVVVTVLLLAGVAATYISFRSIPKYTPEKKDIAVTATPKRGYRLFDTEGHEIYTMNITPDKETGIGSWTEDDFVKAVRPGQLPGTQPALRYPMLPYGNLTDGEAKAIYAYLK